MGVISSGISGTWMNLKLELRLMVTFTQNASHLFRPIGGHYLVLSGRMMLRHLLRVDT